MRNELRIVFTPVPIVCAAVVAPPPVPITRETLPSGVHLIVAPRPQATLVAIEIRVRGAGSGNESDEENGIAHVVEHLVFKGTTEIQPGAFDHTFESMGGESTAQTLRDATAYRVTVLPDKWQDGLKTFATMLSQPAFRDTDWQKERPVILNELAVAQSDTTRIGLQNLAAVAYPEGDAYRHATMGTRANVERFTPDAIRAFHAKWYRPENFTIVVSGNVTPEAVKTAVGALYTAPVAPAPPAPTPATDPAEPTEVLRAPLLPSIAQTTRQLATVFLGFRAPRLSTDPSGAAASEVLAMILARGSNGALGKALFESKTLDITNVSAEYVPQARRALMVVSATGDKRDIGRIEDQLVKSLGDIHAQFAAGEDKNGTLEDLLDVAKNAVLGSQRYRRGTVDGEAQYLAQMDMLNAPADYDEKYTSRIRAVTPSDILRLLERYVVPTKRSVAVIGLAGPSLSAETPSKEATP